MHYWCYKPLTPLLHLWEGAWEEVWKTAHESYVCCCTVRSFAGCHGVGDHRIAVFTLKPVHKRTADHRHSPPAGLWANPTAHLCWKWHMYLLPAQCQAKFSNKLKNMSHSFKSVYDSIERRLIQRRINTWRNSMLLLLLLITILLGIIIIIAFFLYCGCYWSFIPGIQCFSVGAVWVFFVLACS